MNRKKELYLNEVIPALRSKFEYKNVHMVPQLNKIVISMGVGQATQSKAVLDNAIKDMELITGRKPLVTKAKKSISNFKLRAGMPIGCKVTLRGEIMYEFYDKLISIVIPRIRDFKGVPLRNFDGRGNYSLGLDEQTVFPEIEFDKVDMVRGMNIAIVTTANTDEESIELLKLMGFPFRKVAIKE